MMDPETRHLLTKLGEECAEVQQAVSKALLFGLDDRHKDYPSNHDNVIYEIHDIWGVLKILVDRGILILPTHEEAERMILAKEAKVFYYMQYARERGQL